MDAPHHQVDAVVRWVVGLAWFGSGISVAWLLRPRPVRSLTGPPPAGRSRPGLRTSPPRRAVAIAVLAGGVALVLNGWFAVAVAVAAGLEPTVSRHRRDRRGRDRVLGELPDVVDLLALTTSAGLTVRQSVATVAGYGEGPVYRAFARLDARVSAGGRLGETLDLLPDWVGPAGRPLARALAEAVHYGTPLGPALERLGSDLRSQRRRDAEVVARRVPVRLLFPLVLCILPAFALITVVPLMAGSLQSLRG